MATVTATDISIDIPIYDVASTSLRNVLIGRAVGGRFGKVGGTVVINALKNVTFDAREGDRIGLVGRNGSGKTTLLRVLADIYPPTRGSLHVDGRVSPMLDASLGMTADATGLENVRICGVLWGLSPAQIEASLDDVAEFTELGEYLQVPVRAYSAGMLLRLAFAIATLREPDVLLLDEVIAVGDGANDLPMLRLAGLGIAFRAKPLVRQSARQAISTMGLDGILYLLGVRDREALV